MNRRRDGSRESGAKARSVRSAMPGADYSCVYFRPMRILTLLACMLAAATALAQERGVFVEDIDRNANACTNFFNYANGAWRNANPIPAAMTRWSRRWASAELSKDQLHTILEEATKNTGAPKGSVDQQIRDFYVSCMDQERINALGYKPIQPILSEIGRVHARAQLQEMI